MARRRKNGGQAATPSRLLSLPTELLNKITSLVVQDSVDNDGYDIFDTIRACRPLLSVCKRLQLSALQEVHVDAKLECQFPDDFYPETGLSKIDWVQQSYFTPGQHIKTLKIVVTSYVDVLPPEDRSMYDRLSTLQTALPHLDTIHLWCESAEDSHNRRTTTLEQLSACLAVVDVFPAHLVRELDVASFEVVSLHIPLILALLDRLTHLENLRFDTPQGLFLPSSCSLSQTLPVTTLQLDTIYDGAWDHSGLLKLASWCPELETLRVYASHGVPLLDNLPNLRKLVIDIEDYIDNSSHHLEALQALPSLLQLTSLSIINYKTADETDFHRLARLLRLLPKSLESLRFYGRTILPEKSERVLATFCSMLKDRHWLPKLASLDLDSLQLEIETSRPGSKIQRLCSKRGIKLSSSEE